MEKTFLDFCRSLEAPRIEGMVTYPLDEVVLAALVVVLRGADDWDEIELCASEKLGILRQYLPYAAGVAPEQTLRRVFRVLGGGGVSGGFRGIGCPGLPGSWGAALRLTARPCAAVPMRARAGKATHSQRPCIMTV